MIWDVTVKAMMRGLFAIIVLGLIIFGFNNLLDTQIIEKIKGDLDEESMEIIRGKIYSSPKDSSLGDFFIDDSGNLYGLESGDSQSKNDASSEQTNDKIEEFKDSNQEVEIKGIIEDIVEDYGEKRIIVENVEQVASASSCEDKGGSVELREVCVF
jgi:hypothetical protein